MQIRINTNKTNINKINTNKTNTNYYLINMQIEKKVILNNSKYNLNIVL